VLLLWRFHINYDIVKFIPCFIPGVLAFTLSTTKARQSAVLLFAYIMLLAILFPVAVALGEKENLLAWPICLGLGLIIPRCRDVEVKFMTNIGRVVAKYSYGIYIVHGPCIDYVFKVENGLPQPIQWISFFALTSILSYFAYHAIEKPCIELGRRGAHRWLAQRQLRAA